MAKRNIRINRTSLNEEVGTKLLNLRNEVKRLETYNKEILESDRPTIASMKKRIDELINISEKGNNDAFVLGGISGTIQSVIRSKGREPRSINLEVVIRFENTTDGVYQQYVSYDRNRYRKVRLAIA